MFLTLSHFFSAEAQETFVTLTISNQSFPDASSGGSLIGSNVKLYRINVIVNDQSFCNLFASELNNSGNIARTVSIPCNTPAVSIKFEVYYYHHEWNLRGTLHYLSLFREFPANDLHLNPQGISEKNTFNQFTELDETITVNWTLDYNVEITPFKPVVNIPVGKKCYNLPFWLGMGSNTPSFYTNTSSVYDWEYGLVTSGFVKNPLFTDFINGVATNLDYQCPYMEGIDCSKINSIVVNCNYDFITGSLYLFDDPYGNKENIAWSLLYGILYEAGSSLSDEELNFLTSNFVQAILSRADCPIPYLPDISVKNWNPLESGKLETDPVEFISSLRLSTLTDKAQIGFRVKARNSLNGKSGPWSDVENVDLLPSPPVAGSISSISSCINKTTGEFTISDIASPVYTNSYTYRVVNSSFLCNDLTSNTKDFVGNSIREVAASGLYKLCLSYTNPSIKGCVSEKVFSVDNLPKLTYQVFTKDVSCPGSSDGTIRVIISEWAGDFKTIVNGSPVYNTPDYTFSGLPKNSYEVIVKDFCFDDGPDLKTIDQPSQVLITSLTSKNPTCISAPDGGFKVDAAGLSNAKYDYYIYNETDYPSGSPLIKALAQGPSWENYSLPSGSYVINVRDNKYPLCPGVSSSVRVLLPVVPLDLRTDNIKKVKCYGGSDGEIQISAAGGSGIYKFTLGSNTVTANPAKFTALKALSYTILVRNSDQNCADVASKIVTVPSNPLLLITITPKAANCFESKDGQISTLTTGGSGSYSTYSWEQKINGNWLPHPASVASPTNLYAGEYRVKVTDSEGCSVIGTASVNEPAELTIETVTSSDISCFGEKGQINISAQGGNGGYSFFCSANNGASYSGFSSGALFSSGTYLLKVKDSKGCETHFQEDDEDKEVIITEPAVPLNLSTTSSNYNGFNISGYGRTDGSITIIASGGNGVNGSGGNYSGYTYSVAGRSDESNGVFTNLGSGVYTVKVTDGRGCEVSKSVTLTQPDRLVLTANSIEPVKCFGAATGKITFNASGGVVPYSYQLNSNGYVSSGTFTGLSAAIYQISVKDRNGYTQSQSVTIDNKNQPIQITLTPQDVKCFGDFNGQISATVTGGSGSFSNLWEKFENGSWQAKGTGADFIANLDPGQYRLKTTDFDNCSAYISTIISQPALLTITGVASHDIVCFGNNGSIDINSAGGNGNYKFFYSLNEGVSYTQFTSGSLVKAGSYKLKVADSKGCETAWPENLTVTNPPEALNLTYLAKDYNGYNVSCFGNNDGLLTVSPSGGNGTIYQGYSYLLSGRPSQSDNVFTSLTAGVYDISITDGRGCKVTKQVILTQSKSELFLRASSIEQVTCLDDANGRITLAAYGGTSPYTYSSGNSAFVSENEFANLKAGNYRFTVKDVNGCAQIFDTSIVHTVPKIDITGTISDAKCFGQNSGAINVSISGGVMPFTYRWKDNSSVNANIDNLYKGNYTVSVTDAAGCKAGKIFEINEPVLPLSIMAISQPACFQLSNGTIFTVAGGGTPPYLYSVDQMKMQTSASFQVYSGQHNVYTVDANNCRAETTAQVGVRNTMPLVNFMVASSRYELDTLVIKDVSVPKPDRVSWLFSSEAMVISSNASDAKVKYNLAGIYPVKMTGYFGACEYSLEKLLNIAPFDPQVIPKDKFPAGIEKVQISPNPNNGQFKIKVRLFTKQQIQIKILDYYSKIVHSNRYPEDIEFEKDINIQGAMPGTYVLWIITDNDSKAVLFIVSQ